MSYGHVAGNYSGPPTTARDRDKDKQRGETNKQTGMRAQRTAPAKDIEFEEDRDREGRRGESLLALDSGA